ncbi:MAG: helix-turn-helix transcriptional regulator [Acidimicrobiales bacterium]
MTLFERDQVMSTLADVLDQARTGTSMAVFIVADPGFGKTTVLEQLEALATGFTVLKASCSESEAMLPFGLLNSLMNRFGWAVSRSRREDLSSVDARIARYLDFMGWIGEQAQSPLLICVDDLHWSDPDSLELIALACRQLNGLGVAVSATLRPWPPSALDHARQLGHDGLAIVERLKALSAEASKSLLAECVDNDLPQVLGAQAVSACAGNPLLLKEVAAAWQKGEDLLSTDAGFLPERVFLPRFAGVDPDVLHFVRLASIFGSRFRPSAVAKVADYDDQASDAALEALIRAGLVRSTDSAVCEFAHPLFRQALYEDIPDPVRRSLHARAYQTLLDCRAPIAETVPHALAVPMTGDAGAIELLRSAGHAALDMGAIVIAARHFDGAISLAGSTVSTNLYLEAAQAHFAAGDVDSAGGYLRLLLKNEGLTDIEHVAGLRMLSRVLLAQADISGSRLTAQEASLVAKEFDPALACEILLDSVFVGWLFDGPLRTRTITQQVLEIIRESALTGENLRMAAFTADAYLAYIQGDAYGLGEMARLSKQFFEEQGADPSGSSWVWGITFGFVNMAKMAEQFDGDAIRYAEMAVSADHEVSPLARQTYAVTHADTLWRIGRLHDAEALLRYAVDLAELVPSQAPRAAVGLAHLCQEFGRDDESAVWAEKVEAQLARIGESPYLRLWLEFILCRDRMRAGRPEDAAEVARRAESVALESGILEPCIVPWHGIAIEALVSTGQLDKAEELIESLEARLAPLPCQAPRAVAATGRALIAWRRGLPEAAEASFDKALACNAATPMPLARAETLIAKGRFLRHMTRVSEAKDVLRQALEVLEPTGCVRLERIASAELSAAGGRVSRTRRPTELTAQESRVAALAAMGLTNKQISQSLYSSAKTVDHHLSRIYMKLGLSSRRELMVVWRDGQPPDQGGS